MSLSGKIALVTGATRGIGRAIAEVLAEEGADVAVADLSDAVVGTRKAVEAKGRRSVAAVCDVAEVGQVKRAFAEIRAALGEVDILVNNAGIVDNISSILKMTHESWDHEIRVNLGGQFNTIKEALPAMVAKRWGRIVNIASIAALGGAHNQPAYAASKAGVIGLTHNVTLEHGRDGITCNAILPGLIGTEKVLAMPQELRDRFVATVPTRRLGDVREIGYLVAFLASDRAAFINGMEIRVDGGARLNVGTFASRRGTR